MSEPPLWERLETDTDKSFQAFCIYRDMGDKRSLRKVAEQLSKSETIINRWSMNHQWVDRVAAFDSHQDSLRQERNLQRQKLIEDNAFEDYTVIREAIEKYKRDFQAVQFKGIAPHDVSNLVDLMKQADDYARRAVGLPDKINAPQRTEIANAPGETLKHEFVNAPPIPDSILDSIVTDD